MKKQSPIVGKKIKAMVDGGWELIGTVTHDKTDRVILKTDSDEILLLFKKKVSAILLLNQEVDKKNIPKNTKNVSTEDDNFVLFKPARKGDSPAQATSVDEDLSEGGISLPHEVLLSLPEQSKFRGGEDDFSISMTSLFGNGNGRISVTVDDKSK